MSTSQPQSSANRAWDAAARSGDATARKPLPPKKAPEKPKPKPKRVRVRVEGNDADVAMRKWTKTTEALSAEERSIVQGYRLSIGGEAAEMTRRQIQAEVAQERKGRR